MKHTSLLGLCALMAALLIGCKNNETVTNLPCAVYVSDCGDKPDWSKPMGIPARITNDEEDPYSESESLLADCMGDNQLRIIWMKRNQCAPKFDIKAKLIDHTITLTCKDKASKVADCICIIPLYFDFDNLSYGIYSVIAGGVTHTIDFQRDMEPYKYVYK